MCRSTFSARNEVGSCRKYVENSETKSKESPVVSSFKCTHLVFACCAPGEEIELCLSQPDIGVVACTSPRSNQRICSDANCTVVVPRCRVRIGVCAACMFEFLTDD